MEGKKILLGVCGSIAAYKSVVLLRLLQKQGAEVRVVTTPSAERFVGKLSFSTLTGHPVYSDYSEEGSWNNHVELSQWPDLYLIAPATAKTLAQLAMGMAETIVAGIFLSTDRPVWIAPAMDGHMWDHPATQHNVAALQSYGCTILPPEYGPLASGMEGVGRMREPEAIVEELIDHFRVAESWKGRRVLITAGPTREYIDPVRFLSNPSTGTMGMAVAAAAAKRGAHVDLVLGPVSPTALPPRVKVHRVVSAQQMADTVLQLYDDSVDIAILTAAVSDYTPRRRAPQKLKKSDKGWNLELVPTVDIARTLGARKKPHQVLVGFALETDRAVEHARRKLQTKNLDAIVVNSLEDQGAGFGTTTNKVTILWKDGKQISFPLAPKRRVAEWILDQVEHLLPPL